MFKFFQTDNQSDSYRDGFSEASKREFIGMSDRFDVKWLSVGIPQLLQLLEFQYLYNSLIVKVSNVRRVAFSFT